MTTAVLTMTDQHEHNADRPIPARFLLWIDGVGTCLVCTGNRVTIGGPASSRQAADLSLLASLGREHAVIERSGESYLLHPQGRCAVGDRPIEIATLLANGQEFTLGNNVNFRFRQPTALSNSATLDLLSDHRPATHLDGVVLFDETLLLGPGEDHHVVCRDWPATVILFRREGRLHCRSRGELFVDGNRVEGSAALKNGSVVSGLELRFRIEEAES